MTGAVTKSTSIGLTDKPETDTQKINIEKKAPPKPEELAGERGLFSALKVYLLVLLAAVAGIFLGQIEDGVDTLVKVLPATPDFPLRSPGTGFLDSWLAEGGQLVEKGQLLGMLRDPDLEKQRADKEMRLRELQDLVADSEAFLSALERGLANPFDPALDAKLHSRFQALSVEYQYRTSTMELRKDRLEQERAKTGFLYNPVLVEEMTAAIALEELSFRTWQLRITSELQAECSQAAQEALLLEQDLRSLAERAQELEIRAQQSGRLVFEAEPSPGQFFATAELLGRIIEDGGQRLGFAGQVAASHFKDVRAGTPIRLGINDPANGTLLFLDGHVEFVFEEQKGSYPEGIVEYRAQLSPAASQKALPVDLVPGMILAGKIVKGTQPVYQAIAALMGGAR